jgi:flagellar biogenesis protein FliO
MPALVRIFALFFVAAALTVTLHAQTSTPTPQSTEVVSENDRLPFMHTDEEPVQEPSSAGLLVKTLGALVLIVGLIFAGAWGAKKLGFGTGRTSGTGDEPDLSILSTVSLGSGRTISTVRFGDRVLVVGSTAQSFTLLAEDTASEKISFENSRSVAELLEEADAGFDSEFESARLRLSDTDDARL